MTATLMCVAVFPNRQEAELARSALVANHVDAMIATDDGGGAVPALDYTQPARVLVRESDLETARQILSQ